jgi:hypothetical protein
LSRGGSCLPGIRLRRKLRRLPGLLHREIKKQRLPWKSVTSLKKDFNETVTACTDPSWELCRLFCYAVAEGTEALLC